ncbi:MAG TPA: hypothetical protein VFF76_10530 [Holophagaceae bacterium]|jgi:hypothetical protein|nr:hypothetical protein [Holophagaceae bacterium]
MKKMLLLFVPILLACTKPTPLPTPSGKAEVIMQAPRGKVKEALVGRALDTGWNIKKADESAVVMGRRSDSVMLGMLAGSQYDAQPELRIRYDLVEVAAGTRVVSTAMIVTNPDSAFERITTLDPGAKAYLSIQAALNEVKTKVEQAS